MSKLIVFCYFFVLINILYQPVKSNTGCKCINENECFDKEINHNIRPRQTNECPRDEVCCFYPVEKENSNQKDDAYVDECGIRIENRGGINNYNKDNEAKRGEFPWMVTIINNNMMQCGGSLITPSVVLTSAQCLHGKQTDLFSIRAGDWDLSKTTEPFKHKSRKINDFVIHKDFHAKTLHNDIALIFLNKPFEFSSFINSICLPKLNTNFDQQNCIASGWGKYNLESNYSNILKRVEDLRIIPHDKCNDMLKTNTRLPQSFNLHNSFTCAGGEEGKDMCKGDGGGPLMCESKIKRGQYFQAGIVSWGIGCNRHNVPGVYVNVAEFTQWIDEQMVEKGFGHERYYYSAEIENEEGDGVEDPEE